MPIPAQIPTTVTEWREKYKFRKKMLVASAVVFVFGLMISVIMLALISMPSQPALTEAVASPSRTLATHVLPVTVTIAFLGLAGVAFWLGSTLGTKQALRQLESQHRYEL